MLACTDRTMKGAEGRSLICLESAAHAGGVRR